MENITYGPGGVNSLNTKNILYLVKLAAFLISEFFSVFVIAARKRESIINAHWVIPQGFVAVLVGKILRKKVVVTVHGSDIFTLKGKTLTKVKRFVLKSSDSVITNSRATRKACMAVYPEQKYHIISMGVDPKLFKPAKTKKRRDRLSVLFVGRLSSEKGIIYLCQAIKLLEDHKIKCELTVVGDGPEKINILEYIKANKLHDSIKMIGWVQHEDLAKRYQRADVLVSPSVISREGRREGFGLALAEAAACGLPIITTQNSGTADIVQEGVNGYLVKSQDAHTIYNKLAYLSKHEEVREKLSMGAREIAIKKFSWAAVTDKYKKVFASL
jgi:glycosyltransferase involved in cell wall biosynthesis